MHVFIHCNFAVIMNRGTRSVLGNANCWCRSKLIQNLRYSKTCKVTNIVFLYCVFWSR